MQLPPGTRSILASFPTTLGAHAAAEALKAAGIEHVEVDRVSRFGVGNDYHYSPPLSSAATITGPVLYGGDRGGTEASTRALLAADPSVSGYGDRDYGAAGGKAFLLTAVTDKKNVDRAVAIIKQHGGQV